MLKTTFRSGGIVLIAIVLVGLLILATIVTSLLNRNSVDRNLKLKQQTEKTIQRSSHLLEKLYALSQAFRGFAITKNEVFFTEYQSYIAGENGYQPIFDSLASDLKQQSLLLPTYKPSLDSLLTQAREVNSKYNNYVVFTNNMADFVRKDSIEPYIKILSEENRGKILENACVYLNLKISKLQNQLNQEAQKNYESAMNTNTWLRYLLLVIGLPTLAWVAFEMQNNGKQRLELLLELDENNRQYLFDSGKKIGITTGRTVIENSIENLKKSADFVKNMANGNYESHFEELNENNRQFNTSNLVGELVQMQQQLKSIKQQEQQRNWTNEGLSMLNETLRKETDSQLLADTILTQLIKYIGATQGVLFIINDNDSRNPHLELKSTYAYNRKKYLQKQIKPGEGLAGQAWLEAATTYLREIPEDYLQIKSGLGGANPNNILIVPIKTDKTIEGVLELASFQIFEDYQIAFVEKISESLAAAFGNTKNTGKTKQLLDETMQMTEMFKAQEEEMRQNMEELQATQEEMFRSSQEIVVKEANLTALFNNTDEAIIAIDTAYKIMASNKKTKDFYHSLGITIENGSDALALLPRAEAQRRKAQFDKGLRGESFSDVFSTFNPPTQSEVVYEESFFPIRDADDNLVGLALYSKNVTKNYLMQQELAAKEANLQALINNIDAAVISIDREYKVLAVNDLMKKMYAKAWVFFEVGDNVLEKLSEKEAGYRKSLYDRAFVGEKFTVVEEIPERDRPEHKIVMEINHYPIKSEAGEVTGVSVFAKNITPN
ncbi:MAG: GAF domain-containing protein [Verrucomicrobia bacterium]|nr:GAF domain-containing protein [Cytophagales bacterium]